MSTWELPDPDVAQLDSRIIFKSKMVMQRLLLMIVLNFMPSRRIS